MKNLSPLLILFVCSVLLLFCSKKDDPPNGSISGFELKINSFKFTEFDPVVVGEIDTVNLEITALIPRSGDMKITPTIEATKDATIAPPSGYLYDFSQPLDFVVSKNDSSVSYSVKVDYAISTENTLYSISFPELGITQEVASNTTEVEFSYGTDLSDILIVLNPSDYTTTKPESGTRVSFDNDSLQISVFAENEDEQVYTVTASLLPQEQAVRAFWIPAPWHSPFLKSYKEIQAGVALAKELNFNTLYVVAWAQNKILYSSQALLDNSSYNTHEEAQFWDYTGGTGDPLADVISEAHENNLKVILWYEYGFMAHVGSAPTPSNNPILAVHEDWVGINAEGTESNYNGTDFYYNAYNEHLQEFMIDMIMEAVNNYDIDGIQGDDRMPAMPRDSGYDTYTVNRYKSEHSGQEPPTDINDNDWVRWRVDILNTFWQEVYNAVKSAKPNCLVTCSPNPYPWAFDNLMQDWPTWLDDGTVEILSPQCYRSTESSYKYTIEQVVSYFTQHGTGDLKRLVPGVLLYGSNGPTDPELLRAQMNINRQNGILGESFFYDVPLKDENIQKVIKSFYTGEALFPDFLNQ